MSVGKQIRLRKILGNNRRCIIVPMDHGVTVGPIAGLDGIAGCVKNITEAGADAIVLHKGMIPCCHNVLKPDTALVMHLSGASCFQPNGGNSKVLVASVEEAIRMGADAVSIQVTLGDPFEREMLHDFGRVSEVATLWGVPLLAMLYVRGPAIQNPHDAHSLKHAARLAAELGADLVKIPYCGSMHALHDIVATCPIPVLLAGGEKMDADKDILSFAHDAVQAGAAGLSVGRNIFQHEQPREILAALRGIIHDGKNLDNIQ